jgi:MFS family permease
MLLRHTAQVLMQPGVVVKSMLEDIDLTEDQYGSAASIFFIPYVLLEVPSNMILERIDARRWLARIILTWGLISTLMLAITDYAGLLVARFLLGVAEAGQRQCCTSGSASATRRAYISIVVWPLTRACCLVLGIANYRLGESKHSRERGTFTSAVSSQSCTRRYTLKMCVHIE